jgi:hypothetical protein
MTKPQESPPEVEAEWQMRWRRHWIVAGIILAVLLILILGAFLRERTTGEEPPWFFTSLLYGLWLLSIGFVWWNTRCPACRKQPGGVFQYVWRIKNCKNCGTKLRE